MQYLINIPEMSMESNIISLFQREGIQYLKLDSFQDLNKQNLVNKSVSNDKIIPAEEDGDITMLFGKWADIDVLPEDYRKQIWREI